MTQVMSFSREQAFLRPPDAKRWLPADGVAHFVVAAVERAPLGAFAVRPIPGGKAQCHPRRLLALLLYADANGIFSSRRIERATHRDIGLRDGAANLIPITTPSAPSAGPSAPSSRRPSRRCWCGPGRAARPRPSAPTPASPPPRRSPPLQRRRSSR